MCLKIRGPELFQSFFPTPRYFFPSVLLWVLLAIFVWFGLLSGHPGMLELAAKIAPTVTDPNNPPFITPDRVAIYGYVLLTGILFGLFWTFASNNPWRIWSVWGSILIVESSYFNIQIDVYLNDWFGTFFDIIQVALGGQQKVDINDYYAQIVSVAGILVVNIAALVLLSFFVSHYIFRWRTAMNNFYVSHWPKLRTIEGASQRVQEDTMNFAQIVEGLADSFISSVMTLIAFLPVLWVLSAKVTELPFVGQIDGSLVFLALISASLGTVLLALVGVKLPGLQFKNQRVEAAYRKELVYGEDFEDRAEPLALADLYSNVRKNYYRLYFHYMYFNVAKWSYLQGATFIPLFALGPTIVSGTITLGIFQQIRNAFDRVDSSFRFFASAWTTIVNLLSIYKRLRAFEASIYDQPLPDIDLEYAASGGRED